MLFFYGTGTSTIGRYPLAGVSCVHCHTPGSVEVAVYSRYLHLFWVPLIPLGKRAATACSHCQQVLPEASWPPAYQAPARAAKQQARIPVTNYMTLSIMGVLLVAFLGLGAYRSSTRPAKSAAPAAADSAGAAPATNEAQLANPQVGDLYVVHNSGGDYTVMRVERVAPDTLYFKASLYRPASPAATSADSVARRLTGSVVGIPREGVGHLNESGMLTIVRR